MTGFTNFEVALELDAVGFSYPDGRVALRDVSFIVKRGETLVIVGANGAGKSTLLMCLNGLNKPLGTLKVFGEIADRDTMDEIRRSVGVVFQDPDDQLFMPTVFDDVAFGPLNMGLDEHEIEHSVEYALGMVGLNGFQDRLSHHLSFGEKKLVCMASVLSMDPKIIVMDEPTANLDPRAKRHLVGILRELPMTKVISTHDMNIAYDLADKIAVMSKSELVAFGSPQDILSNEPLLLEYGLELPTNVRHEA